MPNSSACVVMMINTYVHNFVLWETNETEFIAEKKAKLQTAIGMWSQLNSVSVDQMTGYLAQRYYLVGNLTWGAQELLNLLTDCKSKVSPCSVCKSKGLKKSV